MIMLYRGRLQGQICVFAGPNATLMVFAMVWLKLQRNACLYKVSIDNTFLFVLNFQLSQIKKVWYSTPVLTN